MNTRTVIAKDLKSRGGRSWPPGWRSSSCPRRLSPRSTTTAGRPRGGHGRAYTAVADDSDGFLWNPAAPARLELSQYSFMHAMPFSGLESVQIGLNSFSYAHPFLNQSSGALGLGWTNLTASSIYREDAAVLSYSRGLYPFTVSEEGSRPTCTAGST